LWGKAIGGSNSETGVNIRSTTDGGFIICGATSSFGSGDADAYLLHTHQNGNVIWARTYGGINEDGASMTRQTADNGFIFSGETQSYGVNGADLYLVKTDDMGNLVWSKTYGGQGNDYGNAVIQTTDGGYAVFGTTEDYTQGMVASYFVKTDGLGNTLCNTTDAGSLSDTASFNVTNLATVAVTGITTVSGTAAFAGPDSLVMENALKVTCSSENVVTNSGAVSSIVDSTLNTTIAQPYDSSFVSRAFVAASQQDMFKVFPNPGSGAEMNISIYSGQSEEILVTVYDAFGRESFSKVIVTADAGNNVFAVDPESKLAPGVYVITATSQDKHFSKKLIIK
jgi:hypothetical protein